MKKEIVIETNDATGANPIAKLVQIANSFESNIYITKAGIKVNAKSIMGMMNLVLSAGTKITIDVSGSDQNQAMEEIEKFFLDADND